MGPRFAKEFLFLGERVDAKRAYELGMVNRVVPTEQLEQVTMEIAEKIAAMPPFGLSVAKRSINQAEDAMGLRASIEHSFGWHQLVHAYGEATAAKPEVGAPSAEKPAKG